MATTKLDDPLGWFQIGMNFRKIGKHEEAMAAFRQSIKIRSDFADAWYYLAMSLGDTGRRKDAAAAFAQAVKLNPALRPPWVHDSHSSDHKH